MRHVAEDSSDEQAMVSLSILLYTPIHSLAKDIAMKWHTSALCGMVIGALFGVLSGASMFWLFVDPSNRARFGLLIVLIGGTFGSLFGTIMGMVVGLMNVHWFMASLVYSGGAIILFERISDGATDAQTLLAGSVWTVLNLLAGASIGVLTRRPEDD